MFDNKNIATLNPLIATTLDSVDGYRKAADEANASQFRDVFLSRANERQSIVADFQAKVRKMGGAAVRNRLARIGRHEGEHVADLPAFGIDYAKNIALLQRKGRAAARRNFGRAGGQRAAGRIHRIGSLVHGISLALGYSDRDRQAAFRQAMIAG